MSVQKLKLDRFARESNRDISCYTTRLGNSHYSGNGNQRGDRIGNQNNLKWNNAKMDKGDRNSIRRENKYAAHTNIKEIEETTWHSSGKPLGGIQ